jgi:hypothetical protein
MSNIATKRNAETQIAQGYDLVQAAASRDIGPCSPQRNKENWDAGAAHRNHRAKRSQKMWREWLSACGWQA